MQIMHQTLLHDSAAEVGCGVADGRRGKHDSRQPQHATWLLRRGIWEAAQILCTESIPNQPLPVCLEAHAATPVSLPEGGSTDDPMPATYTLADGTCAPYQGGAVLTHL